jgi:ankyrin repeat protein
MVEAMEVMYFDDINFEINEDGISPLMLACARGNVPIAQMVLLNLNVSMTKCDKQGYDSLHLAAQYGHLGVINVLCEKGIDYRQSKDTATTPLHLAAKNGFSDICEYLVENFSNCKINEVK